MGIFSGFDPLFSALESLPSVSATSFYIREALAATGRWSRLRARFSAPPRLAQPPSPFVEFRHEALSREVLTAARMVPQSLIILSAAENQLGSVFAMAPKEIRSRIVACFHQPPSWMRLHWRDHKALADLAAVVCLGSEQRDYFKTVTYSPVVTIKHGVVMDFFTPSLSPSSSTPRLLFVGQWLRDFETLAESLPLIWQSRPDVELDCVIPTAARHSPALLRLARDSRVHWHAGLSPERLRDLYHQSTLLFLPLIDAVANNAIVEAMSCGLPLVSSRVGGISEYVPAQAGSLCPPGQAGAHATAVLDWLENPLKRAAARREGRNFVESRLNWNEIAAHLTSQINSLHLLHNS